MTTKEKSIPGAIRVRSGRVRKPKISFLDVLNYIECANQRESRILLNAMRKTAWYVPNQVAYAFDGFASNERREAV